MPPSLPDLRGSRHLLKAEIRHTEWRSQIGAALQRAVSLRGWSLKEFAAAVDRDERQCARWINGTERPQLDVLFAEESLRQPLIAALAWAVGVCAELSIEEEVTIRIRRTA